MLCFQDYLERKQIRLEQSKNKAIALKVWFIIIFIFCLKLQDIQF